MSNTIYKYPFSPAENFTLTLPQGSIIVSVGAQDDVLCVWAIVNTNNKDEVRTFKLFGTGWVIPHNIDNFKFISTIQQSPFVWHLFEVL